MANKNIARFTTILHAFHNISQFFSVCGYVGVVANDTEWIETYYGLLWNIIFHQTISSETLKYDDYLYSLLKIQITLKLLN